MTGWRAQHSLAGTRTVDLARDPAGARCGPNFAAQTVEYSDCWVEESAPCRALTSADRQSAGKVLVLHEVTGAQRVGRLAGRVTFAAREMGSTVTRHAPQAP